MSEEATAETASPDCPDAPYGGASPRSNMLLYIWGVLLLQGVLMFLAYGGVDRPDPDPSQTRFAGIAIAAMGFLMTYLYWRLLARTETEPRPWIGMAVGAGFGALGAFVLGSQILSVLNHAGSWSYNGPALYYVLMMVLGWGPLAIVCGISAYLAGSDNNVAARMRWADVAAMSALMLHTLLGVWFALLADRMAATARAAYERNAPSAGIVLVCVLLMAAVVARRRLPPSPVA